MDNSEIIEKIYKLQMQVRARNAMVANALEKATVPLLQYDGNLSEATRSDLLAIEGVGPGTVDYIIRIINGERVFTVAKDVPEPKKGRLGEMKWKW